MITRCNLPDSITLPSGETLKPVIGGHIDGKPFLTIKNSGVDVRENGWASKCPSLVDSPFIIKEAKAQKLKYRRVAVLERGLRGKLDIYRSPYRATEWVFVEVKP